MPHFAGDCEKSHIFEDELLVSVVHVLDVQPEVVHCIEADDGNVLRDAVDHEGPEKVANILDLDFNA